MSAKEDTIILLIELAALLRENSPAVAHIIYDCTCVG